MSSPQPHPGEITLHGLVNLENRRAAPGKPNTFIFDGTFPCPDQTNDGVASLRHYIGVDKDKKLDNVYDIRAKVRLGFPLLSYMCSRLPPDYWIQKRS